MSRKGNCWDAVMERFFLNLKMERMWQKDYGNHSGAENHPPPAALVSAKSARDDRITEYEFRINVSEIT